MHKIYNFIFLILATWMSLAIPISLATPTLQYCPGSSSFGGATGTSSDPLYTYIVNNLILDSSSCNNSNPNLTICTNNSKPTCASLQVGGSLSLGSFSSDSILSSPMMANFKIYSKKQDTTVCVFLDTIDGSMPLTCKELAGTPSTTPSNPNYEDTSKACFGKSTNKKSAVSFGGQTIECLRDTLHKSFFGSDITKAKNMLKPFSVFQEYMQNTIFAALTLYVVIFGFKIVVNPEESAKTQEVFMFVLKIILVMYFAVGTPTRFFNSHNVSTGGMTNIVLPLLLSAFDSFPNMIYQAAGSNGTFCYFDPASYNTGYSYYAMWDSLDCRVGYYMGGQNNNYGYVLGGLLLSGQIFAFLYALAFIILLLSISLNIITSFVVYLITIYMLVYVAPIFIPMVLFDYTKGYFESWCNLLMSYAIQPFILVSFLALAITMFDTSLNGTCKFALSGDGYQITNGTEAECSDSFAYQLSQATKDKKTRNASFFKYTYIEISEKATNSMLMATLFFIVFYFLLKSMNKMAAALSGGIDVSAMVFTATTLSDYVAKKAKESADQAVDKGKQMMQKTKASKKE